MKIKFPSASPRTLLSHGVEATTDCNSIEQFSDGKASINESPPIESLLSGTELKFKRIRKNNRCVTIWTPAEVAKLKELLAVHGCDFSMISTFMQKSRDQIKRKFKSFEKKDKEISSQIFNNPYAQKTQF